MSDEVVVAAVIVASGRRCRICGGRLSNTAEHPPTMELVGYGDKMVYFCVAGNRHISVPVGWVEEARRTLSSIRRLLNGRFSP